MNRIEAISTADQSWATLVPAIRVASTEMEDLYEAHELSKRQSETGGSQKRKGLGVLVERVQLDGAIRRKHIVIGTQEDLPTESAAQAAVDAIRLEINQQTPQRLIKSISFETLVNHYRQHELPDIFNKTKPT